MPNQGQHDDISSAVSMFESHKEAEFLFFFPARFARVLIKTQTVLLQHESSHLQKLLNLFPKTCQT